MVDLRLWGYRTLFGVLAFLFLEPHRTAGYTFVEGVFGMTLGFWTRLAVFACVLAVAGAIELYLRTQREYRPWVPNE